MRVLDIFWLLDHYDLYNFLAFCRLSFSFSDSNSLKHKSSFMFREVQFIYYPLGLLEMSILTEFHKDNTILR